jgi:nucleotide-binding universal stress UspA family protein
MYKTLLVPVDDRPRSRRSIEIACRIAEQFEANVVGLFVEPPTEIPGVVFAEGAATALADLQRKMVQELADGAKRRFDEGIKASGFRSGEWRVAGGDPAEAVALHARYADLVIINQTNEEQGGASNFADMVLTSLGRPLLLVPYAGEFKTLGRNVLVCWNASREAARAVTDALPFLKRAQRVTVMGVDSRTSEMGHGESPGADISLFLARHGVKAEVVLTPSGDVDVGNVILSRAFDEGADLIVMGAYSHSRARQIVLGGATRTVLRSMTVPVLMSH